MTRPDLVIVKQGRPVAVVEAKGRPIPPSFQNAVRHQLRRYVDEAQSRWSILADPEHTRIFRDQELERPWTTLATAEVLAAANIRRGAVIGERVLVDAVDRWVRALSSDHEMLARHPELREFVQDVSDGVTITEEWPPRGERKNAR